MSGRGSKILNEHAAEVRQLLADGLTHREVGARFGVSPQVLRYWMKRSGVVRGRRQSPNVKLLRDKEAEVRKLFESGTPQRVIADRFGVSKQIVQNWRSVLGIPPTKARGRAYSQESRTFVENRLEIERMFRAGHSVMEIAGYFGVSYQAIYYNLRRFGIASSARSATRLKVAPLNSAESDE